MSDVHRIAPGGGATLFAREPQSRDPVSLNETLRELAMTLAGITAVFVAVLAVVRFIG